MAIQHASAGQPIDTAPFGDRLGGQQTHALFKSEDLEVIRLVLPAGKSVPTHTVDGEITIHCLEGRLEVSIGSGATMLAAHQLLLVAGGQPYSLRAHEPSSALMTIVLRR